MKTTKYHIIILILMLLAVSACNHTRKIERRGGYLLVKNTIKYDNSYLPYDELEGFLQQSAMPGRLTPFFRPGVFFYENSLKGKENRLKLFLRRSFGMQPVILDTNLTKYTIDKLGLYLQNKGFYHSSISSSIKYKRKKASVTYRINSGAPCLVKNFQYHIPDSNMYKHIMADTVNGKLGKGMIYDTYVLGDERDRIANVLKNNSYFNFSLSDIYYIVDTTDSQLSANVDLYIKKIKIRIPGTNDSTSEIQHPRFYIKNIYFTPNADITIQASSYDTLVYTYHLNKQDTADRKLYILHNNENTLKPSFLASTLEFAQYDAYSQLQANRTYKKLISQSIIGSANINMAILNPDHINPYEKQWLDCNIRLIRNKLNTFNFGTEGTNSGGRFGIGFNTSIQNRNLFRGAEVLSLKLRTSAELQASLNNQPEKANKYFLFFNTFEGGSEVSIDFPRILLPYHSKYLQKQQQGGTSLSAGAGFEFRPDFKRMIATSAWSYKWNEGEHTKHVFTPLEFNYVKIKTSEAYQLYLDTLDIQYRSQFTDHLLTMIRYNIIMSNIGATKERSQYLLRLNAETSGNMLFLFDNITNKPLTNAGYYERLGVRYSQFVRFDFDYRKYWKLHFDNSLAFRVMGGLSIPYGNSESVPFEKSFWLGGANDMRGWRLRSLGPGAIADQNRLYDKTGDIMLQSSIEHRFPIYSFLLGSFFIDAGNVWIRKPGKDFEKGKFNLSTFYKQIAMDIGFGLRFDLSFFIFRLDAAVPVKNPANNLGWFNNQDFKIRNSVLNFGIGYPF